jgi:hypothetical protein
LNLKGRVEKLAGRLPDSGVCPCGPTEMRVRYSDEPLDESPAQTCANCGRPREVVRLRVVYADEVKP